MAFWRHLLSSSLLCQDNIIIGGGLNFSLGYSESWGNHAQVDTLLDQFVNLLETHSLVDAPTTKKQPTWRNNRVVEASLARRLDRFLTKEGLIFGGHGIRQWVSSGGLSDHRPIYLEIQDALCKPKAPFKFNSTWLQDMEYIKLITDFWKDHPPGAVGDITQNFLLNMKELKNLSKMWARKKKEVEDLSLQEVEKAILSYKEDTGVELQKRTQILANREASWRLRIRPI